MWAVSSIMDMMVFLLLKGEKNSVPVRICVELFINLSIYNAVLFQLGLHWKQG